MILYIEYNEDIEICDESLYKTWEDAKIAFLTRKNTFLSLRDEGAVELWTVNKNHFAWKHADGSDNTIYHVQLIQL